LKVKREVYIAKTEKNLRESLGRIPSGYWRKKKKNFLVITGGQSRKRSREGSLRALGTTFSVGRGLWVGNPGEILRGGLLGFGKQEGGNFPVEKRLGELTSFSKGRDWRKQTSRKKPIWKKRGSPCEYNSQAEGKYIYAQVGKKHREPLGVIKLFNWNTK